MSANLAINGPISSENKAKKNDFQTVPITQGMVLYIYFDNAFQDVCQFSEHERENESRAITFGHPLKEGIQAQLAQKNIHR